MCQEQGWRNEAQAKTSSLSSKPESNAEYVRDPRIVHVISLWLHGSLQVTDTVIKHFGSETVGFCGFVWVVIESLRSVAVVVALERPSPRGDGLLRRFAKSWNEPAALIVLGVGVNVDSLWKLPGVVRAVLL